MAADLQGVVGLGDPILDIIARVPHEFLQSLGAEPGGCITVEDADMERLLGLPEVQGSHR